MWRTAFSLASPGAQAGRLSVLIFHRVLATPDPLFPDDVHAAQFDQMCGWLKRWFRVLPLDEAVRRLQTHTLPRRALAITFDDGYADNHDVAMPILRRHGLSATFFIATSFLDGGRMWNDTVVESLRSTEAASLDLRDIDPALGQHPLTDIPQRRVAVQALLSVAKYFEPGRRLAVVSEIARRAGGRLPADLMMRSDQVVAMRRSGMLVGAHTVSHPILKGLPTQDLRDEISTSKRCLEQLLGEDVRLFAYPNGKPGIDYDDRAVAAVREAGFDAAVSTAWGAAGPGSDLHQLPRFTPWDRGRSAFAFRMLRNLRGQH